MPLSPSFAERLHQRLRKLDARLLVLLVILAGTGVWLLPAESLILFLPLAFGFFLLAFIRMPAKRGMLRTYAMFALFWGTSFFLLRLWDNPAMLGSHIREGAIFSARLFSLLGLALLIPLASTPLTVGRALTWYIEQLGKAETALLLLPPLRGRIRPRLAEAAWRAGLALALMMSFLPRAWLALHQLNRSLKLRAGGLPRHRKIALMALAVIRILGAQTWDISLSVAGRNLYRRDPWTWRNEQNP